MASAETIAAIATAPGRAGIGVVRVSGEGLGPLVRHLTGRALTFPRQARFSRFLDSQGRVIDEGLLLYFPGPASYTGEDVIEIHGHGGDVVLSLLLERCMELGARLAQPGEFTQRAFFNQKLDLAQAEAVADLISAESAAAVRGAARSLTGEFSRKVHELVEGLVRLRLLVEGSIDFGDEGIEFLTGVRPAERIAELVRALDGLMTTASQGALLRAGCQVVLIGAPNVGKSSLLNALAEADHALVTEVPGTTRDAIRTSLQIEGVPFHIVDTAGIRETEDRVEQAGIERTWKEIARADLVLVVADIRTGLTDTDRALVRQLPSGLVKQVVYNKSDLGGPVSGEEAIPVSAKTGAGLPHLKRTLLELAGWQARSEPVFLARERHLTALREALQSLRAAQGALDSIELLAEELRLAQQALSKVTGEFSSDDLLGEIFSRFCIGK